MGDIEKPSSKALAAVAKHCWQELTSFINQELNENTDEFNHQNFYEDEGSLTWFLKKFVVYQGSAMKSEGDNEQQHLFQLSPSGIHTLSRIRDIASEIHDCFKSFSSHEESVNFLDEIYRATLWRILQDVATFKVYAFQNCTSIMQQAILEAFGGNDVETSCPSIAKTFKRNLLIHIGRFLGCDHVPAKTSYQYAITTHLFRCFCDLVYSGFENPENFPSFQSNGHSDVERRFNGKYSSDALEAIVSSVDGSVGLAKTIIVGGVDVLESLVLTKEKETLTFTCNNDSCSGKKEVVWEKSKDARVLKLFALYHWYMHCEETSNYSQAELTGDVLLQAIDDYNCHSAEFGVNRILPVDASVKPRQCHVSLLSEPYKMYELILHSFESTLSNSTDTAISKLMKLVYILYALCERVKVDVLPPCQFLLVVGILFMKFFHQSDLLLHDLTFRFGCQ